MFVPDRHRIIISAEGFVILIQTYAVVGHLQEGLMLADAENHFLCQFMCFSFTVFVKKFRIVNTKTVTQEREKVFPLL